MPCHEIEMHACLVKKLYLHKNQIGDAGAEKLATALPSMTKLEDTLPESMCFQMCVCKLPTHLSN